MENLIGKTILRIEKSNMLDEGLKLTFTDDSTLLCCWNCNEGYYEINENDFKEADNKINEIVNIFSVSPAFLFNF